MKWTDIHDIVIELIKCYPEDDPLTIRFTDLWKRVLSLPSFKDSPEKCNEKILEAIQMAWLDEK